MVEITTTSSTWHRAMCSENLGKMRFDFLKKWPWKISFFYFELFRVEQTLEKNIEPRKGMKPIEM